MSVAPKTPVNQKRRHAKQLDQNIIANLEVIQTVNASAKLKTPGATLTAEEQFPGSPCDIRLQCLDSLMSFRNKHVGFQANCTMFKMKISSLTYDPKFPEQFLKQVKHLGGPPKLSESDSPEMEVSKAALDGLPKMSLPYPSGGLYGGQYCPPRPEIRADALTALTWVEEIESNLTSKINGLTSILYTEGHSTFCGVLYSWDVPRRDNTESKLFDALQDLTEKRPAIGHLIACMNRDLNWALADKLEEQIVMQGRENIEALSSL
ncbi:hypothetical protein KC340_g12971 [Hortaea werneckii]|nr:hypothetical protein KC342_g13189 [Hortaea werneckii]KAI7072658.1 hypothetical protein KC339_g14278 [Hortaea werneckii]KAI7224903.1 hypothetical protein KC365_g10341 [Hortaea werneckii]KAI7301737.1 hypothetical protein KC340_g12971 [Hortaea werneckii]KAI7388447.1 hypothetical protein KC328_g8930 [Hortaea werneckii]